MFALQRDRWILWLPPAMIVGAALWLLSPRDPPLWAGPALFAAGVAGASLIVWWLGPYPEFTAVRLVAGSLFALAAATGLGRPRPNSVPRASLNLPSSAAKRP